jgi:hypothetical protein
MLHRNTNQPVRTLHYCLNGRGGLLAGIPALPGADSAAV